MVEWVQQLCCRNVQTFLQCQHHQPKVYSKLCQEQKNWWRPKNGCGLNATNICQDTFKLLLAAFESYLQLTQLNQEGGKNKSGPCLLDTIQYTSSSSFFSQVVGLWGRYSRRVPVLGGSKSAILQQISICQPVFLTRCIACYFLW